MHTVKHAASDLFFVPRLLVSFCGAVHLRSSFLVTATMSEGHVKSARLVREYVKRLAMTFMHVTWPAVDWAHLVRAVAPARVSVHRAVWAVRGAVVGHSQLGDQRKFLLGPDIDFTRLA